MNQKKICEVCGQDVFNYSHPEHVICSFECLKVLNPKPKKLKYRAIRQKGRGKSHVILVQEKGQK